MPESDPNHRHWEEWVPKIFAPRTIARFSGGEKATRILEKTLIISARFRMVEAKNIVVFCEACRRRMLEVLTQGGEEMEIMASAADDSSSMYSQGRKLALSEEEEEEEIDLDDIEEVRRLYDYHEAKREMMSAEMRLLLKGSFETRFQNLDVLSSRECKELSKKIQSHRNIAFFLEALLEGWPVLGDESLVQNFFERHDRSPELNPGFERWIQRQLKRDAELIDNSEQ